MQVVVAQAGQQREAFSQFEAVLHKAGQGGDLMLAHFLQPAIHARDIVEAARLEIVRVNRVVR
ncbi:hypothetical protein D3C80_1872420 [compost metagenome]